MNNRDGHENKAAWPTLSQKYVNYESQIHNSNDLCDARDCIGVGQQMDDPFHNQWSGWRLSAISKYRPQRTYSRLKGRLDRKCWEYSTITIGRSSAEATEVRARQHFVQRGTQDNNTPPHPLPPSSDATFGKYSNPMYPWLSLFLSLSLSKWKKKKHLSGIERLSVLPPSKNPRSFSFKFKKQHFWCSLSIDRLRSFASRRQKQT